MPAKVAPETSSTKSDVKKSSMMPMIVGAIALVVVVRARGAQHLRPATAVCA